MMFIYSWLLMVLNRDALPEAIRIRAVARRDAGLVDALFGTLAALTIWQQLARFR